MTKNVAATVATITEKITCGEKGSGKIIVEGARTVLEFKYQNRGSRIYQLDAARLQASELNVDVVQDDLLPISKMIASLPTKQIPDWDALLEKISAASGPIEFKANARQVRAFGLWLYHRRMRLSYKNTKPGVFSLSLAGEVS